MEVGSIYLVISFPENFPAGIQNELEILSYPTGDSYLKIFAYPDGHLLVLVQDQNHIFSRFESQRIRFETNANRIITYIWSIQNATLKINNQLISSSKSKEIFQMSDKSMNPIIEDSSLDSTFNPQIEKWINWRKERFIDSIKATVANTDRRDKSEAEQVRELLDVANNLEDIFNNWISGKSYLIMSILAILRSLLCHKIVEKNVNRTTYNPLLLRVASYRSLPLPVYARPVNEDIPENILEILSKDTLSHLTINEATLTKTSNNQILMDFQEWLNGEVIISYGDKKPFFYSINQILLDSSNTLGASHFDTNVPLKLDFLKNAKNMNIDLLNKLVSNTSQICMFYCKNVLSYYNLETSHK